MTLEKLRDQFLSVYEGGDPNSEDMQSRWAAYVLCARLNKVIPFKLPENHEEISKRSHFTGKKTGAR